MLEKRRLKIPSKEQLKMWILRRNSVMYGLNGWMRDRVVIRGSQVKRYVECGHDC